LVDNRRKASRLIQLKPTVDRPFARRVKPRDGFVVALSGLVRRVEQDIGVDDLH